MCLVVTSCKAAAILNEGASEMRKTDKAATIIKLLKKGYSPKEITERVAVSYNYAWKLKKGLEKAAKEAVAEVKEWVEEKVEPKPEPEVSGVGKVLDARAEQYGSFMQSSDTVVRIKSIMHNAVARNNVHLYPDQLQALDMIATKISRIVHGNPNHLDSWIDIAGYATLVADRIQGKVR
jgi:uncharacterized protein YdhG (YjbR/CyaY superfamily)